jgi:hypothetical protein
MAARKLKLIWQQVHDSTSYLYQPWSFLNIDKTRKVIPNNINSSMTTHDLHNIFAPQSMPMISNVQSVNNTEHSPLMHHQSLSKPSVYQSPMETANVFLQAPPPASLPYSPVDLLPKTQQSNLDTLLPSILGNFLFNHSSFFTILNR